MPKIIEYPRSSLNRALELAETVDRLGGECTDQSAAEHMGNKVGGAFQALVAAAVKFGLISSSKGKLKIEPIFQDYKLAYNDEDRRSALRRAFLSAPLFAAITKRFNGQILPAHFEKLLIREHQVGADYASRIVGYYTEGAQESGIIAPDGTVNADPKHITLAAGGAALQGQALAVSSSTTNLTTHPQAQPEEPPSPSVRGYTVRITGPGIDTSVAIKDEDDLEIVEVTLKKVRRLLKAQQELMS